MKQTNPSNPTLFVERVINSCLAIVFDGTAHDASHLAGAAAGKRVLMHVETLQMQVIAEGKA